MYEKHPDRCQYHGNLYDYGTIVDHSLLPPCINEAKCVASSDGPKFEFVHQEPVPVEAGCLPQYTFDSMCNPSQKVCDPVEKKKLAKCHLRGKEYYEGQLFTPTFSSFFSSACYQCICDASFENDTAPAFNKNCRKFKCAIELFNAEKLKNGCVPVYETKDIYDAEPTCCCPIDFVCRKSINRFDIERLLHICDWYFVHIFSRIESQRNVSPWPRNQSDELCLWWQSNWLRRCIRNRSKMSYMHMHYTAGTHMHPNRCVLIVLWHHCCDHQPTGFRFSRILY